MNPVKDYKTLPKFLQVTEGQTSKSYNKYLPRPYKLGEIVKVQPEENQVADHKYDNITPRVEPYTDEFFRKRFCRIYRKDERGQFSYPSVLPWDSLDYLRKK